MPSNAAAPSRNDLPEIEDQEAISNVVVDAPGVHEISELAHHLWVERGRPMGSPEEDWFNAEQELRRRHSA